MKFTTLATDYDATLADAGRVENNVIAAVTAARSAQLALLLVSGRELHELLRIFPQHTLFHRIIAENGAVLYEPATRVIRMLAPAPPPRLLEELSNADVPVSIGRSIVTTDEAYRHVVLEIITRLGLEWHMILNKGSLMVLPSDVTKASGLAAALKELAIAPAEVVAVGDAENDQAMLRMCGFPVAVANALPAVKQCAKLVTQAPSGQGVIELIEAMLCGRLERSPMESLSSDEKPFGVA